MSTSHPSLRSGWHWFDAEATQDGIGPRWIFYYNARSHARVMPLNGKWIVWIASPESVPRYGEWKHHLMTNPNAFDDLEEAKRYAETVVRLEGA